MKVSERPMARKGSIVAFESDAWMARQLYDAYARLSDKAWKRLDFSEQTRWLLVAARVRQMAAS